MKTKIKNAQKLTYNPATGALYADGEFAGGADDLTEEIMIDLLGGAENVENMTEEDMFEALVEIYNDPNE